jgi:cytochrome c oxidase subunit 4
MSYGRILAVWAGLLALLALTVAASFLPLGPVLPFVSYGIASAKAGLIIWFFMEMRDAAGLQRLALTAGFVWALFLFLLMLADPLTRVGGAG